MKKVFSFSNSATILWTSSLGPLIASKPACWEIEDGQEWSLTHNLFAKSIIASTSGVSSFWTC